MRLGQSPGDASGAVRSAGDVDARERVALPPGLLGTWSATRWQYTSHDDATRAIDVVCDMGGAVTLSLSAGLYVVSHAIAGDGVQTHGGTCEVVDDQLRLASERVNRVDVLRFRLAAETLSLQSDDSAWDFSGEGRDERAAFVAVLVRL